MQAAIQKLTTPHRSSFIYRMKSSPAFRFNWHFHPEYELTLILKSQGKRFVADSISDYRNGDLVLLGPNLPHTWQSLPHHEKRMRHKACVIQFHENFLGESVFDCVEFCQTKAMLERSGQGLSFTGRSRDEASKRMVALGQQSGMRRLTAFLELLDLLARSRKAATICRPGFVPSLHTANHRRIDRVCNYVNENFQQAISQPQVAELVEMSPSVFSSFFKRTVGLNFVQYVNNLRTSHSCRLLIESELSILEISHQSGFNNLSNFNRCFLKAKGMSPRKYRSEYRPVGA